MASSLTIGHVRGIPLRLHWSFLLVLPLFAYLIGRAYFAPDPGALNPGIVPVAWGAGLAVFLFGTVLLHELGHSLTALRYGVNIRHITLLPIGGVSAMEETPTKPGQELRITAMGPVVNFVIGIPLLAVAWWLAEGVGGSIMNPGALPDAIAFVAWAGILNVFIGAFNMFVPAFPMDGGRLLRAFLAQRMGMRRATSIAAGVGRGLAVLMGLFGFFTGAWLLVLIAIFVWIGANEEEQSVAVTSTLGDLRVGRIMTHDPEVVSPDNTVAQVFDRMMDTKHLSFPVADADRPIGTVHLTDLAKVRPEERDALLVRDVQRAEFDTLTRDDKATDALKLFRNEDAGPVLVVDDANRLVGVVTRTDVVRTVQILSVEQQGPSVEDVPHGLDHRGSA